MVTPKEEGLMITEALFEDWGTGGITRGPVPYVDGREAILAMKKADFPAWQDVEWAGYYIKFLIQEECKEKLAGKIAPYSRERRHLVKGNYVWDTRLHAGEGKVILGDVIEYNGVILDEGKGSIGLLVVDVYANTDLNGDFRRWHEELKGGLSDYTREREREGRSPRDRKTAFAIRKVLGYYFTMEDFRKGIEEGWLRDDFQRGMRNYDGSPRNAKYLLILDAVPPKHLLFVKNFNEDPDEFKQDFPDYI